MAVIEAVNPGMIGGVVARGTLPRLVWRRLWIFEPM